MSQDFIRQFREAIQSTGIKPPDIIYDDGQIHRFATNEKPRDTAGWYILYKDQIPVGVFGDWRTGSCHTWHLDMGRALNKKEAFEYQRKIEQMRQTRVFMVEKEQLKAREWAIKLWNNASLAAINHPYLIKKNIKAYGVKEYQDKLIIPLLDNGKLVSLQFIGPDGNKRFLRCGKVKGCYFTIGVPKERLCICEGYATGASIFEATGYPVAVAFNADNLIPTAQLLRHQLPNIELILCADDDFNTPGNPGLFKAQEAASLVKGKLAIPRFGENCSEKITDFNDLHQQCGIEVVKKVINYAIDKPLTVTTDAMHNTAGVELICAADLKPEAISWVWPGWLATGKFHLLAGAPGTGKTTLGLNLAAIVTRGSQWPDGMSCVSGNVLIWSGEDSFEDILLPRLLAHGANVDRIYFISGINENNKSRVFDPAQDIPKLYDKATEISNVRLILIDPIVNVVAGDSHKNGEVRRALQPLVELGNRLKAVILGISHFSKASMGRDPLERVTGSIAFGALARVVLATVKTHEEKRLLVRTKSNLGPDKGGYYYEIKQVGLLNYPDVISSQVEWGSFVEGTAEELLIDDHQGTDHKSSALKEAVDFLKVVLSNGPVLKKEIATKAKEQGFTEITLRRAKNALGIKSIHDGYGTGSVWKWSLPSTMTKTADPNNVSVFGSNERLCADLMNMHPAIVEGCKLSDILAHAIPQDYEALKDFEILSCLARSLKESGQVKDCSSS